MSIDNKETTKPGRRRNGLLLSLIGLLILVEVVTVAVVLVSQRFATARALTEHTQELLRNVVDETRENAAAFLSQTQDSVSITAGVLQSGILSLERPESLERYLLEQLKVIPQMDAVFYGDIVGDFIFSKKTDDPDGAFVSKFIRNRREADRVTLVHRDAMLLETSRSLNPDDPYDPRQRQWYQLAAASDIPAWSAPYVFYTSKRPGLTVARAVRGDGGRLLGVVGADIELSALSHFLRTQQIGDSGAAFIVYNNGDVIAHPDQTEPAPVAPGQSLHLKKAADFDPATRLAAERLHDRFPDLVALNHPVLDHFDLDARRYTSLFVPFLDNGETRWVMGAFAPDDEMALSIRKGLRESVILGVAMAVLSITLALILALLLFRPINALQRQAREDPLTGLLNRRSFDEMAARLHRDHAMSVIMIDVDNFKSINDEWGHAVGDEVLQVVARRIKRTLSDEALLARYGGEEFAILLPDSALDAAIIIAERIREQIAGAPVKTSIGTAGITISLGIADINEHDDSLAGLLDRADQRLLLAKKRGRNLVVGSDQ